MDKRTLKTYGKINLGLQIYGKRKDGYHDIETIFYPVNPHDTITIIPGNENSIQIECTDPRIPTDETNLCYIAANLFLKSAGITDGINIIIEKNIPAGAGLGGGSSNAAAVLRLLNEFCSHRLTDTALHSVAVRVGSDVPYFLNNGPALAKGRGEILERLKFHLPYWIVVVFPGITVSTSDAFGQFQLNSRIKQEDLKTLVLENLTNPPAWMEYLRNDLEPSIFNKYPEIMQLKEILLRGGADFAQMSGSGSSVYGLFHYEKYARDIVKEFPESYRSWITEPTLMHHQPADSE